MGCGSSRSRQQAAAGTAAGAATGAAGDPVPRRRSVQGQKVTKGQPWKHGSSITQHELQQMRAEFWQTRVSGNSYIWQAIRVASEALLEGDVDLCNSILEASAIVCSSGSMTLCYDDTGAEYRLPKYCFSNPKDMLSTLEEAKLLDGTVTKELQPGESITLKMQVAPIEKRFEVPAQSTYTIAAVKQALYDHIQELPAERQRPVGLTAHNQRLIYCGRELTDSQTLTEAGIVPENVLQVYLRRQQPQT